MLGSAVICTYLVHGEADTITIVLASFVGGPVKLTAVYTVMLSSQLMLAESASHLMIVVLIRDIQCKASSR